MSRSRTASSGGLFSRNSSRKGDESPSSPSTPQSKSHLHNSAPESSGLGGSRDGTLHDDVNSFLSCF